MARNKIEKELNKEQGELVLEHLGYARSIALNYRGRGAETNDLIQEAYLALCEAVLRFDEKSCASIVTFSTLYINGQLAKYIMKNVQRSYTTRGDRVFIKMLSLDKHIDTGDDTVVMTDVMSSDYNGAEAERELELERLENVMRCLTKDEIELIESRFKLNGDNEEFERLHKEKYNDITSRQLYRKCEEIINKMVKYAENKNL